MKTLFMSLFVIGLILFAFHLALKDLAAEPRNIEKVRLQNLKRQIHGNENEEKTYKAYGDLRIRGEI